MNGSPGLQAWMLDIHVEGVMRKTHREASNKEFCDTY